MGIAVRFPLMDKPARDLKATFAPSGNSALGPAGRVGHTHHIMVLPLHMLTYSYLPSP